MKQALSLAALIATAVAVSACGGSSSSSSKTSSSASNSSASSHCPSGTVGTPGTGTTLRLAADPSGAPKYSVTSLTLTKAGPVTIALSNTSTKCHDIALKTPAGKNIGHTQRVKRGTAYITVNLPKGTYVYYSTVPGDEPAGMQGSLIVK